MTSLPKVLLDRDLQGVPRLLYGVATGTNTVKIAGSTVAVTLPALEPVTTGDYVAVLAAGADRLILGAVAVPWTNVSFENSWANYGTGSDWGTVKYAKFGGRVHLRGLAKDGTVGGSTPMFTLPAGFRPFQWELFVIISNPNVAGRLNVYTNGQVCCEVNTNAWVSLFGISFSVAP